MSHDNAQGTTPQDEAGVARRKFILGTAAATAGMWAAPSILSVDRAFAQVGSPGPDPDPDPGGCMTSARALTVTAAGLVNVNVGPFSSCQDGTGGDEFASATVTNGTSTLVSAEALDTDCRQAPTCRATASVATLRIDLTSLGIPLVLTADVITATAECTGGPTTLSSSIAELTLTANSVPLFVGADVSADPNTTVVNIDTAVLDLKVILNEQVGDTVNAIHITASVPNLLDPTRPQTVDIIVASATASCT